MNLSSLIRSSRKDNAANDHFLGVSIPRSSFVSDFAMTQRIVIVTVYKNYSWRIDYLICYHVTFQAVIDDIVRLSGLYCLCSFGQYMQLEIQCLFLF